MMNFISEKAKIKSYDRTLEENMPRFFIWHRGSYILFALYNQKMNHLIELWKKSVYTEISN